MSKKGPSNLGEMASSHPIGCLVVAAFGLAVLFPWVGIPILIIVILFAIPAVIINWKEKLEKERKQNNLTGENQKNSTLEKILTNSCKEFEEDAKALRAKTMKNRNANS